MTFLCSRYEINSIIFLTIIFLTLKAFMHLQQHTLSPLAIAFISIITNLQLHTSSNTKPSPLINHQQTCCLLPPHQHHPLTFILFFFLANKHITKPNPSMPLHYLRPFHHHPLSHTSSTCTNNNNKKIELQNNHQFHLSSIIYSNPTIKNLHFFLLHIHKLWMGVFRKKKKMK